jgi:imidazolonepropionase-like amidohydrolase
VHAELLKLAQQQLKQAVALGVPIMAGTDTPDSFVFAGSGLIDELELYTQAGLTPLQALQSATLWPAQYAGVEASAGSVEVGKDANLLLVSANPLQQIQALRQVEGVVLTGHWYDKPQLQALQNFSTAQAGSLSINLQLAWSALQSAQFRQQFAD